MFSLKLKIYVVVNLRTKSCALTAIQKCSGTCNNSSDAIRSIRTDGDSTYGVNCHHFYDYNCERKVGETTNAIFGGGKCYTPQQATSGYSFLC